MPWAAPFKLFLHGPVTTRLQYGHHNFRINSCHTPGLPHPRATTKQYCPVPIQMLPQTRSTTPQGCHTSVLAHAPQGCHTPGRSHLWTATPQCCHNSVLTQHRFDKPHGYYHTPVLPHSSTAIPQCCHTAVMPYPVLPHPSDATSAATPQCCHTPVQ